MSSFLTRTINTSRTVAATLSASRIAAAHSSRAFTTTYPVQKTATETVKDGLKTVDRAVSDKLVDGIDLATAATEKVKDTAEKISTHPTVEKVQGKAQELSGQAQGKASELSGQAQGKAEQLKGQAKGTAEQAKGKAKGAAEEVKGKM
ncbi:hypothetical protein PT974_03980 [Cladobotryum mycophilum]|uniref:LEA domain protein n=1 Tax=Cladobotryum mycophilum TaxID=491253 RepID=A0ABR0SUG1_9HYPO